MDEERTIRINSESDGYQWFELNNLPDKMIDAKKDILHIMKLAKENFQDEKNL